MEHNGALWCFMELFELYLVLWLFMVLYDRSFMELCGTFTQINGALWSLMEHYGALWSFMEHYGALWSIMEKFGALWSFMEHYRALRSFLEHYDRILWTFVEHC